MIDEQITKIDDEITRLNIVVRPANKHLPDMDTYLDGRTDALKWVKENL